MFVIRTASSGDVPAILRLLQEAGLRGEGVDKHPDSFWVLEEIGNPPRIAGTLGMEVYGRTGLLRSFVVERERCEPASGRPIFPPGPVRRPGRESTTVSGRPGFLPFFEAIRFTEVRGHVRTDPRIQPSEVGGGERRGETDAVPPASRVRREKRRPFGETLRAGNSAGGCDSGSGRSLSRSEGRRAGNGKPRVPPLPV